MEYSRTEIRPGVWLTHLREDKFKTACFSVSLLSQLNRETGLSCGAEPLRFPIWRR